MLKVSTPFAQDPALRYLLTEILVERLGLEFSLEESPGEWSNIAHEDRTVSWRHSEWRGFRLPQTCMLDDGIPYFDVDVAPELTAQIDYDFFYYAFLILSRFEETLPGPRDRHQRFPLAQSFLQRFDLLGIPVVDVYTEALRRWFEEQLGVRTKPLPKLKRQVSFDVDQPRDPAFDGWSSFLKSWVLGRVPFRPDLIGDSSKFAEDPFFTFPYLFSKLRPEHHAHIFFIPQRTNPLDGTYELTHQSLVHLRELAAERNLTVGVHGSYDSFNDAALLGEQRRRLGAVKDIRQHFLRFDAGVTWRCQIAAGFSRDWSLGFAEMPGFRAGTCHAFRPYSFTEQRALEIIVEPLLLMDVSLAESKYLGLTTTAEMVARARPIFEACERFGGHFNVLFHNPTMLTPAVREFYEEVLSW